MTIEKKVLSFVRENVIIEPGDRVLAGLSAGPDSTFMLYILKELSRELHFDLSAAYFDHRIREIDVLEREKEIAGKIASDLKINLFVGSADVPGEAKKQKIGLEEAARNMRLSYLEETARKWGATKIALGHTLDDQVETIIFNIIRGTGIKGLLGIPIKRGMYIRPIACCRRNEIMDYLNEKGIKYSIDKTNEDTSITRNRIRKILLPLLREQFNPSVDESILRLRENAAEILENIKSKLGKLSVKKEKGESVKINLKQMEALSDFEIYLLLDSVLKEHFSIYQDIERHHFNSVKLLLRKLSSGKRIQLPHNIEVIKEHDTITIRKTPSEKINYGEFIIPNPGEYTIESWNIKVEVSELPVDRFSKPSNFSACFYPIEFPIRVRQKRDGDKMKPLGLKGTKKLSDIFIDKKIGITKRSLLPIFEDSAGIFWIPGVATDWRARKDPRAPHVIKITIYKL